jgi:heme A synthase
MGTTGSLQWSLLPAFTRRALTGVAVMSLAQVGLGITTLLLYVPVSIAAVHQVKQ